MTLSEASEYVGRSCVVSWYDKAEHEYSEIMRAEDVLSVPLYGDFLIGDAKELKLDKVTRVEVVER